MRISILIITSFLLYGCDYITQPGKDAEEKKMAVATRHSESVLLIDKMLLFY